MGAFVKNLLPKSLLGRALLIIVSPLVLLQVISALIFYETHWDKVSYRLARSVGGDVAYVINMRTHFPGAGNWQRISELARSNMDFVLDFQPGAILPNQEQSPSGHLAEMLARGLDAHVHKPYRIDDHSMEREVAINVQLSDGVLKVITPRKRLFSSTTYVFVLWMVGSSLILFGVATVFMRNQVRPIRRLAIAAEDFGKGRDVERFKPEGAREVRQAAQAFLAMKNRIERQIRQRTDMLSGVSHDLRTPLTRMKLQLAMAADQSTVQELKTDISDMEHMLEGYLAFAKGEGSERPVQTDLSLIMREAVEGRRFNGAEVDLHLEDDIELPLRPNAFKRCVTNLVENASKFGEHVLVRAGRRSDGIEIIVDDDGPGIPEAARDEVFRPFFRLEGSRNPGTGGVGLGLTIARDVVRGHGGEIRLEEAPAGGLRARIQIPI